MLQLSKSLLIGLFVLLLTPLHGAHLVGGEITYECLGGSNYEITLRVYRDCASGGAAFDASIDIGVFNANTGVQFTMLTNVTHSPVQQVPLNSGDPCLTIPPGLCTEYVEYVTTVSLPASADGYDITWQRCCRNGSISNIPNPGTWGNTYTVRVPANDPCASAPAFANTPPIVICVNEPLNINASANDLDGDSLYYEFCEILHGGSQTAPVPVASAPPYQTIPFVAPQTFDNPIPSSPNIKIDSLTGMIHGTANVLGQFVVGICVSSYRNGALETMVRRDFQFNVSNCVQNVVSDMVTQTEDSSLFCAGRTIQFSNESTNALTSFWDFGVVGVQSDTSTLQNPVFQFPGYGSYDVTLIANPNTSCADTVVETWRILPVPDLQWGIFGGATCFSVQGILFGPLGDSLPNNPSYEWYFGGNPPPNITHFIGAYPPAITWPLPGEYPVTVVMKSNTCVDSIVDTVDIVRFSEIVDAGPDQIIVEGEDVLMDASGGVEYLWYADNPVYFSDPRDPNTLTRPIRDTTVYYVEVTTAQGCQGIDSMTVIMVPGNYPEPDYGNIQNVITPNGDGLNDYLDLKELTRGREMSFTLQNRWGALLYSETVYDGQWHGQNNGGEPLPDGTYYFTLQYGSDVFYQAPVTILRNEN